MSFQPVVYIVDDDASVRDGLSFQLESAGFNIKAFSSCSDFLAELSVNAIGCLILDVRMPKMTGPELQNEMSNQGIKLPIIYLTGYGDIPLAVKSIKKGAVDFITKPVDAQHLLNSVQAAIDISAKNQQQSIHCHNLEIFLTKLTKREFEIYNLVIKGNSNKQIATQLAISFRTVEHHRSNILLKTASKNFLQLLSLVDSCR
jgi:two-component system, LuxR family, response regulator FixJ